MVSAMEVKLLTLLNVSAVKRPREQDIPGGHRGSPALSNSNRGSRQASVSAAVDVNGSTPAKGEKTSLPAAPPTEGEPAAKRRRSVVFGGELGPSGSTYGKNKQQANGTDGAGEDKANGAKKGKGKGKGKAGANGSEFDAFQAFADGPDSGDEQANDDDDETAAGDDDLFNVHFGIKPPYLQPEAISSADNKEWESKRINLEGYGQFVEQMPAAGSSSGSTASGSRIIPSLMSSLKSSKPSALTSSALSHVGSYRDLYLHSLDGEADGAEKKLYGESKEAMRKAVAVHALNHVLKRKIVRNNEKLAHATAAASDSADIPEPPQDQSFTRPKILLLLPLRSLALHYLTAHLFPLAPPGTQIENYKPFVNSFSIPKDAADPLAAPSAASQFAIDHLVNFRGNSDDNFRIGIKITRKAWRVVMMPANEAKLMDCDILIASPLAIKMQSEKEDSTDLLASIEVLCLDGADVMLMQNWDHVQSIFQNLNKIPQSPHGCDFSRVKPWYLDQQAKYLRQTILLSRYDAPEVRALLSQHCHNLAGKLRLEAPPYKGSMGFVRQGVRQVFERVDLGLKGGEGQVEEVEKRLQHFMKKTVPALLRSAVSRQHTMIVVPSYFDFVRLSTALRKADNFKYLAISEYSSNSEISRARTLFFKGKVPFLLMTERFHFYRRYRIRGAKTIVWYQPPEHSQFYSEILETPFLPAQGQEKEAAPDSQGEVEVDEGDISAVTLYSRYDKLRMERVIGSRGWREIMEDGQEKSTFM